MMTCILRSTYEVLDELDANGYPNVVLAPANDGMLHAALEEDAPPGTGFGKNLGLDSRLSIVSLA